MPQPVQPRSPASPSRSPLSDSRHSEWPVGPAVRHDELSFCFVYKFRQRFGIVADAIARGLGHDTTHAVAHARQMDMFLDDLECCKKVCGSAC